MSSLKKDEQLRREGMSYALRVAKENGVEDWKMSCIEEMHRKFLCVLQRRRCSSIPKV